MHYEACSLHTGSVCFHPLQQQSSQECPFGVARQRRSHVTHRLSHSAHVPDIPSAARCDTADIQNWTAARHYYPLGAMLVARNASIGATRDTMDASLTLAGVLAELDRSAACFASADIQCMCNV